MGRRTRRLSLVELAGELDWEAALVWVDARFEYDELRMIALAPKTHGLDTIVIGSSGGREDG